MNGVTVTIRLLFSPSEKPSSCIAILKFKFKLLTLKQITHKGTKTSDRENLQSHTIYVHNTIKIDTLHHVRDLPNCNLQLARSSNYTHDVKEKDLVCSLAQHYSDHRQQ